MISANKFYNLGRQVLPLMSLQMYNAVVRNILVDIQTRK
jgi:hypothetical protein